VATGRGKAGGRLMRVNTPDATRHVFRGHVRPGRPTGSGYHYRPGGQDWPDRRLVPGTAKVDGRTGAYKAKPEFFDPTINPPHGAWKPKGGNQGVSSFFPDHWTPAQVDTSIAKAFETATAVPGTNRWKGAYRGLRIEGYYDGAGGLLHGWPVVKV
jgi:Bacterial EndoU nuclease